VAESRVAPAGVGNAAPATVSGARSGSAPTASGGNLFLFNIYAARVGTFAAPLRGPAVGPAAAAGTLEKAAATLVVTATNLVDTAATLVVIAATLAVAFATLGVTAATLARSSDSTFIPAAQIASIAALAAIGAIYQTESATRVAPAPRVAAVIARVVAVSTTRVL